MENKKQVENQNQIKNGKEENQMTNKVVKLNETQEVTQEIKEIATTKSSNQFDLEIAQAIVNGTVKKTELSTVTELEKAKLEHEASLKFKEVEQRLELRRMELRAKEKIVKEITDAAVLVGVIAGIATTSILNTKSNNTVKLEKIKQGIID